jgi:stage V sporulation protein G
MSFIITVEHGRAEEQPMEITDIRVRRVGGDGKLKAYVTVTLDDCFVVHNIKVIHGRNGTFIAMPSRRTKTGEYKDVAHPINSDFRQVLQERVLAAYEEVLNDPDSPAAESQEDE